MARYVYWFNVANLTEFQCGVIDGMSMGPNGPGHGLLQGDCFGLLETDLGIPDNHKNIKDIVAYLERNDCPKKLGPKLATTDEMNNICDAIESRLNDMFDELDNEPFTYKDQLSIFANEMADKLAEFRQKLDDEYGA